MPRMESDHAGHFYVVRYQETGRMSLENMPFPGAGMPLEGFREILPSPSPPLIPTE